MVDVGIQRSDREGLLSKPPRRIYLFLWLTAATLLAVHYFSPTILWDATVYARAIDAWRGGQNPYSSSNPRYLFVYPPVFLYVGSSLARLLPDHSGWFLYVAIYFVSSLALPFLLARYYLWRPWLSPTFAYVLVAMQPRFTGFQAFMAGNITNIFYLVVLLAGLPGMQKNRWGYFYLGTFLVSTVKVNFLIMLLIPLLIGRHQWLKSSLCGLCTVATYPLQKIIAPQLFEGFRIALARQIAGRDDYGYGVMRIVLQFQPARHYAGGLIPYALQAIFVLVLIYAMFALRRKLQPHGTNPFWPSLVLLATILCNPRILQYDSDIALLAGLVLLISALGTRRMLLTAAAVFLPSIIIVHLVGRNRSDLYETFVLLISFAAGYWMLSQQVEHSNRVQSFISEPAVEV